MAIEYGFCMVCGIEIAPHCGDCGTRKPGSRYTQVELTWSNGSIMPIAVCVDCAVNHKWTTAEAKAKITKDHQDHWTEQGGEFDPEVVIV